MAKGKMEIAGAEAGNSAAAPPLPSCIYCANPGMYTLSHRGKHFDINGEEHQCVPATNSGNSAAPCEPTRPFDYWPNLKYRTKWDEIADLRARVAALEAELSQAREKAIYEVLDHRWAVQHQTLRTTCSCGKYDSFVDDFSWNGHVRAALRSESGKETKCANGQ